jgi:hypothetical protein
MDIIHVMSLALAMPDMEGIIVAAGDRRTEDDEGLVQCPERVSNVYLKFETR